MEHPHFHFEFRRAKENVKSESKLNEITRQML